MLNQEKVKDMTRMAIYEKGKGQEELYVTSYRRGDYVALQLIKSFILGTIAAGIILLFYLLLNMDFMDKLNTIDSVKELIFGVGIFYIIFLAAYMVLTFFWARKKYKISAAHAEEHYTGELNRVVRSYQTPEEIAAQEEKKEHKLGFLKRRK